MSDDDLRQAWLDGAPATARSGPAPTTDDIWAAAHGEMPTRRALDVLDRALDDPDLRRELRIASAFAEALDSAKEPAAPKRTRHMGSFAIVGALAAALLAVWWVRPDATRVPEPGYRDAATSAITAESPPVVPRSACVLRWRATGDDVTFDVVVSTDAPAVIARATRLASPEFQVPPERLVDLPAGAVLHWQVEMVAQDGSRTRSHTFSTTLE